MRRLLPLLALAACTQTPPPPDGAAAPATPGRCVADGLADLIGKPTSDALEDAARTRSGSRLVRRVAPDSVVTMDLREDRLNVKLDAQGIVTAFTCG